MGDLKRGVNKVVHWAGDKLSDVYESFKEGSKQIGETLGYEKAGATPKSDKTKQKIAAATPPVIPFADEDELRRDRRRRLASEAGRTGRVSTILSQDDDMLG